MLKTAVFLLCAFGGITSAEGQNFLRRIGQPLANGAVVTVTEDETIDHLVNGGPDKERNRLNSAQTGHDEAPGTAAGKNTKETAAKGEDTEKKEETTVDLSPKVMRNSYKINGYRVQVYAGGNSRKDRQQAERAGRIIKENYPDEPCYVHFYSPRWICRVGNYRSYEEAYVMLLSVKELGFKAATIVKGKITVKY